MSAHDEEILRRAKDERDEWEGVAGTAAIVATAMLDSAAPSSSSEPSSYLR